MPSNVVKPRIEVAGTPLAPEIDQLVEQVVVDDSRTLPDMFVLRFRDPDHSVLHRAGLTLGAKVKVFGGPVGGEAKILLISGEVTGLEAEIDETGTHVVARGYDVSHRLQRGRNTRTFVDTSEGEIVRRIASQAGIDLGEIEDPPTTHALVSQANQSDYDFLRGRAREIGFDLAVRGDKLYFQLPIASSTAPAAGTLQTDSALALVLGANLNAFLPRITAAEQVNTVEVRGWDPATQQTVLASADAATTSVTLETASPALAASAFASESKFVLGDRPLTKDTEVQRVADAVAEQIGSAFAEADGIADGDPTLRAGSAINIAGVGSPFEGRYTVTASRHVIGPGGYKTHFTVSGRQERSLLGLASSGETSGDASAGGAPIYGVVIGIVSDCDDPEHQGRVRIKLPWLSDDYASDWARVVSVGGGDKRGIAFVPEVNDEVLVAFEQGDVRSPFVLGGLWSGKFEQPQSGDLVQGGEVVKRVLQSRNGHRIVLSDSDDDEGISITSKDGSHHVTILTSNPGTIEIKTTGTVKLSGQTIELKGTSVSIEAEGTLDLKGASVSVSSDGPATIKGTPLMLN
jgi:phage protein D/phage baseplate assembly protein gpV